MAKRRRRLGLTSRIALTVALGAMLLTSIVATSTYLLLQNSLLDEASNQAQAQAWRNARDIENSLIPVINDLVPSELDDGGEDPVRSALTNILRTNQARILLNIEGEVPLSPNGLRRTDIPEDLRILVEAGGAGELRALSDGEPQLYVGVWVADIESEYYEVVPLDGISETLNSLRAVLIGVTMVASALGALLGWSAARGSLYPIASVTVAAEAIAAGDFSTRLDPAIDPDLTGLSSSFNKMVDALEARIERDERFTSDVSHELRSPLMTLTASVEVLERRQAQMPETARQAVQLLSKDLRRFRVLVEDLLEISRIDAGAAELEESTIVIADFLRAVLHQSRFAEVPLEIAPENRWLRIVGDKRRLAQVMTNLLDNARKYAGGADRITVCQTTPDRAEIRVIDSGPGVPRADRDRIFHRFTRAGADAGRRDKARGVGLGLSLAFEHVRLHGGTLGVRDRTDGSPGAVFYINLPLDDSAADEEMAS